MSSYLDFAFLAYDFVIADIVDHYSVLKVLLEIGDCMSEAEIKF